jgi:NAD(P)-dependent dehydrogenase (short-subunit alcohol dehydrogenase family)
MIVDLTGRTAIVTGGSRGIGKAIATALAKAGACVTIVSRKAEVCAQAAADIGHGCAWIAANVGDEQAAVDVARKIVAVQGRIDILVNNAATNPYVGLTVDVDLARWNKTLQVNLTAPLLWTQAVWRAAMRDGEGGCAILNVASVGGLWTSVDHGVYDVSKAALMHLTRQHAAELGPKARVNAIAPGLTKTDFNAVMFTDDPEGQRYAQDYPMQRLGDLQDMASAATFLCSDHAGWITGQTLVIDGGGQTGFARVG